MQDSVGPKSEVLRHWQNMFDDLKEWYKVADNRATGIISINSMLLGFVTISAFVSFDTSKTEISIVNDIVEDVLLVSFFISIMFSVCLAILSLWGRGRKKSFFWFFRGRNQPEEKIKDNVFLYFGDIARRYRANEDNKEKIGEVFFDNEFNKYISKDNILKATATQIVILSTNLYKRFSILNMSYILIVISIILMSAFTFVRYSNILSIPIDIYGIL